jgi:hypothetical protein
MSNKACKALAQLKYYLAIRRWYAIFAPVLPEESNYDRRLGRLFQLAFGFNRLQQA